MNNSINMGSYKANANQQILSYSASYIFITKIVV